MIIRIRRLLCQRWLWGIVERSPTRCPPPVVDTTPRPEASTRRLQRCSAFAYLRLRRRRSRRRRYGSDNAQHQQQCSATMFCGSDDVLQQQQCSTTMFGNNVQQQRQCSTAATMFSNNVPQQCTTTTTTTELYVMAYLPCSISCLIVHIFRVVF